MSADIVVVLAIFLTALGALHLLHKAAVMTFRTALDRLEKRLAKVHQEAKACSATAEGRQEKVVAQINERIEAVSSHLATLESQQSVVLRALTQVQQDHKSFQSDKAQIMIDLVEQRRTLQQYVTRMKLIIVAVFDSGVDDQHEDLRDSMWTGPGGSHGYNFVGDSTDVSDRLGHGTHCAGTIAAHRNNGKGITGIAEAKLMSLNICDDSGACNVLLVFRAFEYALEHGARISSHSYLADTGAALLEEAYKNAGATGHVMIFAAGNDNQEIGTSNYPCTLSRLIPTSVCVTHVNLDEPDKYMLAKKANYGPYVDMAAPGIGVLSTLPNSEYGYMSGSSMAAPHVAGVAGVLASMNLTGEDIIRALRASVLPLSESNTKFLKDGGGFLNARQAVMNALTLLNGGQVTTRRWGSETTQVLPSGAPESESSTSVSPTRTVPSSGHTITNVLWTSVVLLLIFWA
ncbi:Suppressor of the cold-sensitive snRNP bioproteinsis mutant brr1-1 [Perkinsus olseni]|uniref:subtilisin n=1 Tax=Perkinsus olseni TaxID=32597 RepID=A0A7J6P8S3_PEROL|nr:Suppressor of the cold-sensitive snRNP bioproteinsis mutant brr1-1 [Perkinsus olseni]